MILNQLFKEQKIVGNLAHIHSAIIFSYDRTRFGKLSNQFIFGETTLTTIKKKRAEIQLFISKKTIIASILLLRNLNI